MKTTLTPEKQFLNDLAAKNPYLSETEVAKKFFQKLGKAISDNLMNFFRNATEDYRIR